MKGLIFMSNKNKKEIDWIVHYVCGGDDKLHFKPHLANIHTHGMRELYNHPEFQIVLTVEYKYALYILNKLGCMVQSGRRFKPGEKVSGIGICDLPLYEATDNGKPVLRVIIPDKQFLLPDDERCGFPYNLQYLSTEDLME